MAVSLFPRLPAAGTDHGMTSHRAAMDDICNNRFQGYRDSSEISRTIANVHANLCKVVSWAGANYEASVRESNRPMSAVAVNPITARLITKPVKGSVEVIKKVAGGI
ncbi:MAG: hypothetical protein HPY67_02505 [Syntrophaceae bacterium]|nr:hypothetical protein [Syntrophaceae bacterium]